LARDVDVDRAGDYPHGRGGGDNDSSCRPTLDADHGDQGPKEFCPKEASPASVWVSVMRYQSYFFFALCVNFCSCTLFLARSADWVHRLWPLLRSLSLDNRGCGLADPVGRCCTRCSPMGGRRGAACYRRTDHAGGCYCQGYTAAE
jgi:hypothetical protein